MKTEEANVFRTARKKWTLPFYLAFADIDAFQELQKKKVN